VKKEIRRDKVCVVVPVAPDDDLNEIWEVWGNQQKDIHLDLQFFQQERGEQPGGRLLTILMLWLESDAKYLCYARPTSLPEEGRLRNQIEFMQAFDLSACYGEVLAERPTGSKIVSPQDFSYRMIGLSSIPTESMLIDKEKFMEAGGFDHALSAGYRPEQFIIAFSALGGNLKLLPQILMVDTDPDNPYLQDTLNSYYVDDKGVGAEMWRRIRFDSFVSRTREFYKRRDEKWR